jgi:PadR family transcriptional regulator PadR
MIGVVAHRRARLLTLSPKETLILELLIAQDEMYGLQLVAASRRRLKRGTVYVTLGRMEDKGYITSRLEDGPPALGGLPRRLYQPTSLGRRVMSVWTEAARHLVPEFVR